MSSKTGKPFVLITEQPSKVRFRYGTEGLTVIHGINSTPTVKTFPKIQIVGYKGKAIIVISCVTKDEPYRPHPFIIDGKHNCKKGVCTIRVNGDEDFVEIVNIGIKRVLKKDIRASLSERQQIKVDPFKTGFDMNIPYDNRVVRMCFQVILEGENGKYTVPLTPIVSDPIYDKKNYSELVLAEISECCCEVEEEKKIIILCGKIYADDVQVRFFEEKNGVLVWEDFGSFVPSNVHREAAISFKAPKYFDPNIEHPVKVSVQLRRPSDQATSAAIPFEYLPSQELKRKRKHPRIDSLLDLSRLFQGCDTNPFMNIKRIKADMLPNPSNMEVHAENMNAASNAWQLHEQSTNSVVQPINEPHYFITDQAGPSTMNFHEVLPFNIPTHLPNLDFPNGPFPNEEFPIVQEQNQLQTENIAYFDLTNALPNNVSPDVLENIENLTDSFTKLMNDAYTCGEQNAFN